MFLDLRESGKIAPFLRAITFPFRERPNLEIPDESDITVIVEAGFGNNRTGFGWPDAVISARTPQAHIVLFLEAKAGLYRDESEDFTATRAAGFNSTINGQFSLRYWLSEALCDYRQGMVRLIEHEEMTRAYGEQERRRLAKMENLRQIVEPHLLDAEYLFVALTNDESNPWPTATREARRTLPFLAARLPLGAPSQAWTDAGNIWEDHNMRFGWVSFRTIESMVGDGEFFKLSKSFLLGKRCGARGIVEPGISVGPRNWDEAPRPEATLVLRDLLRPIIGEEGKRLGLKYEEGPGSDSLIGAAQRRLLKLMAPVNALQEPDILLGVAVGMGGLPPSLLRLALGTVRIPWGGLKRQG